MVPICSSVIGNCWSSGLGPLPRDGKSLFFLRALQRTLNGSGAKTWPNCGRPARLRTLL